ncbi:DUF551 domain-containing protein [Salmonella enterica]|nr:DUF551 domain-containing protein [Salmonella enterica]
MTNIDELVKMFSLRPAKWGRAPSLGEICLLAREAGNSRGTAEHRRSERATPAYYVFLDGDDIEFNAVDEFSGGRSGGTPLYTVPQPVPGQWIACNNELPPVGVEVAVYAPQSRVKIKALARYIRFEADADYFWATAYEARNLHPAKSVTHWSPLPAQPRGEK